MNTMQETYRLDWELPGVESLALEQVARGELYGLRIASAVAVQPM